jgi:hypothetical protein
LLQTAGAREQSRRRDPTSIVAAFNRLRTDDEVREAMRVRLHLR